MEFLAKDGPRLPLHPIVTDKGHRDGAGHDEGELGSQLPERMPARSRKLSTFAGSDMPDNTSPRPKIRPIANWETIAMMAHPKCRATKTVRTPVAMKVMVATSERTESREMPHTP